MRLGELPGQGVAFGGECGRVLGGERGGLFSGRRGIAARAPRLGELGRQAIPLGGDDFTTGPRLRFTGSQSGKLALEVSRERARRRQLGGQAIALGFQQLAAMCGLLDLGGLFCEIALEIGRLFVGRF